MPDLAMEFTKCLGWRAIVHEHLRPDALQRLPAKETVPSARSTMQDIIRMGSS